MKLGLLSESPADEAAIRILIEAVLKEKTREVRPHLRARGWPNVLQVLPAILRHLQFQTDADALIVVVDSDDTIVHEGDHADPNKFHPHCRICQIQQVIRKTRKKWRLSSGRKRLKTAVGLAVPAVEGWYLLGKDDEVGEEDWISGLKIRRKPYSRKELKQRVYRTVRPSLHLETRVAKEEAVRVSKLLGELEENFPVGFGSMIREIRGWQANERV
jgi:hypothetical protein